MGKVLIIKGADFSANALYGSPSISISREGVVTISASYADAIYYTTNGTTPTASSTQYSTPFTVQAGTTIKAIAVCGENVSDVATGYYEGLIINYKVGMTSNWTTGVIEADSKKAVTELISAEGISSVMVTTDITNPNSGGMDNNKAFFYVVKCFGSNNTFIGNATPSTTNIDSGGVLTTVYSRQLLQGTITYRIVIAYNEDASAQASHIYDDGVITINGEDYTLKDGNI